MRILVYSPVSERNLRASLGKPEYSYLFVLRRFLPLLEQLGDVRVVEDPERELDSAVREARADGEHDVVLLSFAPPNRSPDPAGCPMVTVFAWEFDTLPNESWGGDWREDWTKVLAAEGGAVTLSTHSRDVVKAAMGDDFPVVAIPAPIHDRFVGATAAGGKPADMGPRDLRFSGVIIDSREFEVADQGLTHTNPLGRFCEKVWDGAPLHLSFTSDDEDRGRLVGFYMSEPWGAWSQLPQPWILLPVAVRGQVAVTVHAAGYASNAGREITVAIGECERRLTLTGGFEPHRVVFDVPDYANTVVFKGLRVEQLPASADVRSMGLGLCAIQIERVASPPLRRRQRVKQAVRRSISRTSAPEPAPVFGGETEDLALDGVVYTSVFNPNDGRKNWPDMVTAFAWAFRDTPDATLLLKMTHHSLASYFRTLQFLLHRVGPVKCRILAIQGYFSEADLPRLAEVSTYYVNASEAEGLCMPLMEFMSAGVPAVAPNHSAMRDYVTPDSAFVVRHSAIPAAWPHDGRGLWRSTKNRVHWDSLAEEFRNSYDVATHDPERYAAMSRAAVQTQAAFSSDEVVGAALGELLKHRATDGRR